MEHYSTKGIFLIVIACVILAFPAGASLNTIKSGDTVFIGEQGLDISGQFPAVTAIGWWSPGNTMASSEPDHKISIPDSRNIYISQMEFSSRTGPWYSYPGRRPVFNVADPYINIKIEDRTVNVDVTGKWAPWRDELGFRIETNLYTMAQRSGGSGGAPVSIRVQTPEGSVLSSVINRSGTPQSLDVGVAASPYVTANIWDTGNLQYNPGTYMVWAECNENQMKDNYNQAGKTYSAKNSVLVQDQNPLISAMTATITPTTVPATHVTTSTTTKATTIVTTQKPTPVTTNLLTPQTMAQETVQTATVIPSPSPTPTKAAGFTTLWTILAGIISCAVFTSRWR
jgi:Domain of unknown function (DUF3821)